MSVECTTSFIAEESTTCAFWLHTAVNPPPVEWDPTAQAFARWKQAVPVSVDRLMCLIVTDGGGPSTRQRRWLVREVHQNTPIRMAIVTTALDSLFKRRVASAVTWLNPRARFFEPGQFLEALDYVDLGDKHALVEREYQRLSTQLRPNRTLQLIQSSTGLRVSTVPKVLWLEADERFVAASLGQLRKALDVSVARCPDEAWGALGKSAYDAIILDLSYVGSTHEGLALLERIRRAFPALVVVPFSGSDSLDERVRVAFDGRAEDFVIQRGGPAGLQDLCSRVRLRCEKSQLERVGEQGVVTAGVLRIEPASGIVLLDGKVVSLSAQQRALLVKLAEHADTAVPHVELCAASRTQIDGEFQNLRNQIWRLKGRLGKAGRAIRSERKRGWRLSTER